MQPPSPRALVTLGLAIILAATVQWGPGSNDEMDQAAAYHNLRHGSWVVLEHPDELYTVDFQGEPFRFPVRSHAPHPVGSTMLNVLALPGGWLGLDTYPALQTANMLAYVATAWFLWPVIRARVPNDGAAAICVLGTMLGPLMFWGHAAKYHALSALLVTLAIWLQDQRAAWARYATGLVTGLALWNHIGAGAVTVAAIGLAEIRQAWRTRSAMPLAARWAPMLAGAMAGLTPFLLENAAFTGNPLTPFYFAGQGAGKAAADVTANEGPGFLVNLAAGYILPIGEGDPVPVLLANPLFSCALAFIPLLVLRRRRLDDATALAVGLVIAQTILYTNWAPRQGFGHDMRMYSHILPALGLLAAAVAGPTLGRLPVKKVLPVAAGVLAILVGATQADTTLRAHYLVFAIVAASCLGTMAFLSRFGWAPRPDLALMAMVVALPLLWTAYFVGDFAWLPQPHEIPITRT